jgi:hypothetical protein
LSIYKSPTKEEEGDLAYVAKKKVTKENKLLIIVATWPLGLLSPKTIYEYSPSP